MIVSDRFHYSDDFQRRCADLLTFAFENVPLYREWKHFDPGSNALLDERYDALPVLTKADMRSHFPLGLMPKQKNLEKGLLSGEIEYTFTSGTTSEKVVNIWNQDWWDRSEAASWKLDRTLSGLSYPQKQAKLASSLNVGINCEEDLPMDHRILGNTLYLNEKTSILQWQPRHLKRMADELNTFRPVILEANPSLLARLSWWALDNGVEIVSPAAIVFTFEFSSAICLAAIRRVFPQAAFVSSYGSTETGFVMEQCEDGLLHQNTEFCRIDFQPVNARYGDADVGQIVVSTFDNPWNVIVRFAVGDLIRLHKDGNCTCGRSEGMLADAVEGRTANVTFSADGGLVTTKKLDDALAAVSGLRDYHLEQKDGTHYMLEAVMAPGTHENDSRDAIHAVLERIYGKNGIYHIQLPDRLLPGPAGKFRRTQVNFEIDERRLFE